MPCVINERVVAFSVNDGDYNILVKKPVLWHGGIRPCKIKVIKNSTDSMSPWNVNCSMILSISMCSTFGADFYGDEMTLFPLKTHKFIEECKVEMWSNKRCNSYSEEGYRLFVLMGAPQIGTKSDTMALATTICWSDRLRGHTIGHHHTNRMTESSYVIKMKDKSSSHVVFFHMGMQSMHS